MFENSSFGRSINLLQKSLDVGELRRTVIANNVANVDTPNFKRSDVSFEAELKRAIRSENSRPAFEAKVSDSRHMPFHRPTDAQNVEPRVSLDYLTQVNNNGNNVDIEQEEMDATKNQMLYELMVSAVSHEFTMVNMVIR